MINVNDFFNIIRSDDKSQSLFRLGTIDPAYIEGKPRVIFDGETEPSTKGYCFISGYIPAPNDRVLLVCIGGTYIIQGAILDKIEESTNKINNPIPLTVTDTADTTYSTNEVTMLNSLKSDAINLRNKLIEVIGAINKLK